VNKAIVNEDPNAKLIRELREELERLRSEVGAGGGGGSGGATSEEAELLKFKLLETEHLLEEMTMSWEDKLKRSQDVLNEHQKLMDAFGASVSAAGSGLSLKSKLPHFVHMHDSDITIYPLKEGLIRIGLPGDEGEEPQDIEVEGHLIAAEHCLVEYTINMVEDDEGQTRLVGNLPFGTCPFGGLMVEIAAQPSTTSALC
jgi:hypothetical protein